MARRSSEDAAGTELDAPTGVLNTTGLPAPRPEPGDAASAGRTPWHDRPSVLTGAAIVGAGGLIALAVSVVTVSDQSLPSHRSPATSAAATPAPASITTITALSVDPSSPAPAAVQAPVSVPDFAAGPTAEMEIPPSVSPVTSPGIPAWLARLFAHLHGEPG